MPPRAFCLSFTFAMSAESSSASAIVTRPPRDHIGEHEVVSFQRPTEDRSSSRPPLVVRNVTSNNRAAGLRRFSDPRWRQARSSGGGGGKRVPLLRRKRWIVLAALVAGGAIGAGIASAVTTTTTVADTNTVRERSA